MTLSYSFFTSLINGNYNFPLEALGFTSSTNLIVYFIQILVSYMVLPLRVLTFLKENPNTVAGWQNVIDAIYRIIGTLQLALVVLALRSKVKRH